MVYVEGVSYSPYGAFELKATYQRNALLGTLGVLLIGVMVAITMWALQTPMETIWVPPQPPTVPGPHPQSPPPGVRSKPRTTPPSTDFRGAIPHAVEDDLSEQIDTAVVISPNEFDYGEADDSSDGTGLYIDTNVTDALPEPGDFIPLEIQPEIINQVSPEYPLLAKRIGTTGVVTIQVLLDEIGTPIKAIVGRSSGSQVLDEAALSTAFKNSYKPGIQNGLPVACWVSYRVEFSLDH